MRAFIIMLVAALSLPAIAQKKLQVADLTCEMEKGIDISKVKAIGQDGASGNDIVLKVGSGTYSLEYPWSLQQ